MNFTKNRYFRAQVSILFTTVQITKNSHFFLSGHCCPRASVKLDLTYFSKSTQDEVRDPRQVWGRRTWVADRGLQTEQTRIQVWTRQNRPWSPWARPNRPKANTGPYRTDPTPTLARPKRLSKWARPNRPKANTGPDRTDPRPTLGQTEQTQHQHWPDRKDSVPGLDRTDPRPTLG